MPSQSIVTIKGKMIFDYALWRINLCHLSFPANRLSLTKGKQKFRQGVYVSALQNAPYQCFVYCYCTDHVKDFSLSRLNLLEARAGKCHRKSCQKEMSRRVLPVLRRWLLASPSCPPSSPRIQRPDSSAQSVYLAISACDLSAICNIKASVSTELNGNKREAFIND